MLVIATIGPSTREKQVLRDIIDSGANMLRLNFSHGDLEEFEESIKIARSIKKDIYIMQDLSGSKIRVSEKLPYIIKLYNGEEVLFCGEDIYKAGEYNLAYGNKKVIPLNMLAKELYENRIEGISMKDNTMIFHIIGKDKRGIKARVVRGGIVRGGKGCNIKGFNRRELPLSEKDRKDIKWGIEHGVEGVCQSFVEDDEDINKVKKYIRENNLGGCPEIWGKVETPMGIKNIESIVKVVDGIVIGRGDLVPEGSIECTPIYENKVIKACINSKKKVVIATHILNSMKDGKRPELPEVESIYNFIKVGVSGFLLAGETSVGRAPIKTVEFLCEIINRYSKE